MKATKIGHMSVKSERSKYHYFLLCGKREEKENLPGMLASTVEPPLMATRLIQTPRYTDSLLCPRAKPFLTFSVNSSHLMRTLSMAPQCPY